MQAQFRSSEVSGRWRHHGPLSGEHRDRQRRTIFLTGASGVVGRALLARLHDAHLVCLTRQNAVSGPNVTLVHGDVSKRHLGLEPAAYRSIAQRIDCVVHSAAATGFNEAPELLERVNVEGTRHALELASQADVPLYHLSTAFVRPELEWPDGFNGYESSKRKAEALVMQHRERVVVIRPSLIVGDSITGEIARFGGFYLMLRLFLKGYLPVVPTDPEAVADFVPQDAVAGAIAALIENGVTTGEYWLTAGERALRLHEVAATCVAFVKDMGRDLAYPKFVSPDTFERLIKPVFVPALPSPVRRTLESVMELLKYFSIHQPFPSSLPDMESAGWTSPVPPAGETLRSSLRYSVGGAAVERVKGAA